MTRILLFFIIGMFPLCSIAQNEPKVVIHRTQDTTKNESGWYFAKSTEGNFSGLMPIPFNDFTVKSDEAIVYSIGSKSQEGIKFSVSEIVKVDKKKDIKLDEFVKDFNVPPNIVSKEKYKNLNSIYFEVSSRSSGAFMKYVKTRNSLFILMIEFPNEYKETVKDYSDGFFNSLEFLN